MRWLLAACVVFAVFAAWVHLHGPDRSALEQVRRHIESAVDGQRTLGEVFDGLPDLQPSWIPSWGDDARCAALVLSYSDAAACERACPGLLGPLRAEIGKDRRLAGIADDQPVAVRIVFQVDAQQDPPAVAIHSVTTAVAWAVMKPDQVSEYEQGIEAAIAACDDASRMAAYRLRHDGDRALLDVGQEGIWLAGSGMRSPLDVLRRLAGAR